ncbi:MAG TPA: FMN-binding protein [Sporichthyaceae bacterium]|jgi:uncharacterized protein with FMN-binding domain
MRRISFWFMSTLSALVLMFSYHTSTNSIALAAPAEPVTPDSTTTTVENATEEPTTTSGSTTTTPSTSTKTTSGTYTGSRANTRWGIVQVQITVKNGKITNSQAIQYPSNNGRDQQINAYALPILSQEVISAQSANIDAISGATVTTNGYRSSLQSAIDQAHL